jgi:hypothetical protein
MRREEKQKAFEYLEKNNYLEYGTHIPASVFERLIGVKCSTSWDFLGPLLEIREMIIENGYLCTQRDLEFGCIRIYGTEEFGRASDRLFNNLIMRMNKLKKCVVNTNLNDFNEKDATMHRHSSNKICSGMYALKSCLASI